MTARAPFLLALLASLALAGCQPAPVGIEEAQKVEPSFDVNAPPPAYTPPPRSLTDVLTMLKQIKPNPSYGADLRRRASAEPAADLTGARLAAFLFNRGTARSDLGDSENAVLDLREAVRSEEALNTATAQPLSRYLLRLIAEEASLGNHRSALVAAERHAQLQPNNLGAADQLARSKLNMGDFAGAEQEASVAADILARNYGPQSRNRNQVARAGAEAGFAITQSTIDLARGRYAEAEEQSRRALNGYSFVLANFAQLPPNSSSQEFYERIFVRTRETLASILLFERRYAEAEAEGREALRYILQLQGATSATTALGVLTLAGIVGSAGRVHEAEQLAQAALDIYAALGLHPTDGTVAHARSMLGTYQVLNRQWQAAAATFASLSADLQNDADAYDRFLGANSAYATSEIRAGRPESAVKIEERCVEKRSAKLGPNDFWTADCRARLGAALKVAGRRQEALAAFKAALPILIALSDDDPASNSSRAVRFAVGQYLRLLDEIRGTPLEGKPGDAASEGFLFADALRSASVREALSEATARMSLPDPALADLARREQDLGNQRQELDKLLLAIASAPPSEQDPEAIANLRRDIVRLGDARATLRQEIARRFPRYADLVSRQGASVDEVRALLRPDEALIVVESLDDRALVWAVAKNAPLAYASVPMHGENVATAVAELRRAVDPHATSLRDIPPFDVAVAHQLYAALLEPVAQAWHGRKNLIIVAGGPLAQIPLSLLVTETVPQPQEREGQALFTGYRNVPFLIREAAVTQLPSVSALMSLRRLPPGPAERRPFIGFGDPWFNPSEAAEAERQRAEPVAQVASRGGDVLLRAGPGTRGLDSAALSQLPRLPDTEVELREVAKSLGADPNLDVYVGARASEETVETMKLDDRRVAMFATHGLVPGDIDGLTQPALALSPPSIAGGRGDGLLTASKILGLKLDADWVVLSACNTAAEGGAGADAVSGLGRAFFYAGARALLVTNWPVETVSARLLTTGIFRHQAEDSKLSRAEALQQSELDVIDGKVSVNAQGRAVYAYAHPIFWAPFSLVGDGGG